MEVLLDRDPYDNRCLSMAADTYYWQGAALEMLAEETKPSFDRAIQLQRQICNKSKTVNTRGMLLKILARAGEVDEATKLADEMADESDQMMSCGYAACGYALLSEHLETGSPEHTQAVTKAVDLATKLVRHGYRDFEALRTTDLDFKPLQTNADYLAMLDQEETATTEK